MWVERRGPGPSGWLLLLTLGGGADCHRTPSATVAALDASRETVSSAGSPCGELECAQFDAASEAVRSALPPDVRVVAFGEAHAQRGATARSAASRFTAEILPDFAGHASDLVVELMKPPQGCADAAAEVRQKQAPATAPQAPTNPNEYLAMGERARALGIVPDMLRPSCADLDRVADAGDEAIEASLALIARLTTAQAQRLLDRDARSAKDHDEAVLLYGGLLHNNLAPPPEQRAWTYAPALDAKTGGRVVAIDLVVPEFIGTDKAWRKMPWVAQYDRARLGNKVTRFRTGERSYVIVFAETGTPKGETPPPVEH
jgi:hypothetical protein